MASLEATGEPAYQQKADGPAEDAAGPRVGGIARQHGAHLAHRVEDRADGMEDHEADTGQQTELDPGDDDQGQGDAGRQTGLPAAARGPDGLEMEAAVPGAAAAAELFLAVTAPAGAAVRPLASPGRLSINLSLFFIRDLSNLYIRRSLLQTISNESISATAHMPQLLRYFL